MSLEQSWLPDHPSTPAPHQGSTASATVQCCGTPVSPHPPGKLPYLGAELGHTDHWFVSKAAENTGKATCR